MLGYNYDWNAEWCGLPEEIYNKGLPEEQEKAWMGLLKEVRVPWIDYPNICIKCGKLWPDLFSVPDDEWKRYIQKSEQNTVICRECYDFIKESIDSNN
jgi:ferredoxin